MEIAERWKLFTYEELGALHAGLWHLRESGSSWTLADESLAQSLREELQRREPVEDQ